MFDVNLSVRVLAGTSSGNATLVWHDSAALMVDCGLSDRYISGALQKTGIDLSLLKGVLITHAHVDHAGGTFLKTATEAGVPVFVSRSIHRSATKRFPLMREVKRRGLLHIVDGNEFSVAGIDITTFPVPHDAPGGCVGYSLAVSRGRQTRTVTLATDIGNIDNGLATHLLDSDVLIIESNHDETMLMGSSRPWWLKQRIRRSHLSNTECSSLIRAVMEGTSRRPVAILPSHISTECNTHHHVLSELRNLLDRAGWLEVGIHCSHQRKPGVIVRL